MIRPRIKHADNDPSGDGARPSNPSPPEFNRRLFKNATIQAMWLTKFKERNIITGQNIDDEFFKKIPAEDDGIGGSTRMGMVDAFTN